MFKHWYSVLGRGSCHGFLWLPRRAPSGQAPIINAPLGGGAWWPAPNSARISGLHPGRPQAWRLLPWTPWRLARAGRGGQGAAVARLGQARLTRSARIPLFSPTSIFPPQTRNNPTRVRLASPVFPCIADPKPTLGLRPTQTPPTRSTRTTPSAEARPSDRPTRRPPAPTLAVVTGTSPQGTFW